jgi:hypothetical protein
MGNLLAPSPIQLQEEQGQRARSTEDFQKEPSKQPRIHKRQKNTQTKLTVP